MVNSFSASASEILAAAIQDYKEEVIISKKEWKTVQNVIDKPICTVTGRLGP
jgi:carboxyl-terminal processing protease